MGRQRRYAIQHYSLSPEDGTETSINTIDVSTARSSCTSSCGSSDVYYGVRKYDEEQFQCKCFDRKMETVVAEASQSLNLVIW